MQGRLNIFQKSMLQWNEMHPYSAAHAVQIRGALDATRLRISINTTVEKRGLTHLRLRGERWPFEYEGGPADCEIRTIGGEAGPRGALVAEMERQLNLRFRHTRPFSPFRFFVAPAGDSFFLGLVYFHPVADAESVVCVLKDIVTRYVEQGTANGERRTANGEQRTANSEQRTANGEQRTANGEQGTANGEQRTANSGGAFDLYPDSRAHLWRQHPLVVARKLLALPAQVRRLRQSHRASCDDADNLTNGFVCFSVAPEHLRSLVAAARAWGVTVNDLFLALLMKALSPCAAGRAQARKRRKISVGCIVNLRKDLGVASQRVFGLFLGSFIVTHEVPAGISLRELAGDIRQQTSSIKRHKLYLGTPLELGFARVLLRFFSPGRRKRFYAKYYPLWGGITNMNLNLLWEASSSNALLDYFRGVSTGPITPLVLSATTVGERVNMGLSYRTAVFSRTEIDNLQRRFQEHLEAMQKVA